MKILTINDKKEKKFLHKKTTKFDFQEFTKKEIQELIKDMRETMETADGIGLSANQVGLNLRLFVAYLPEISPDSASSPRQSALGKFYAIFNPETIKPSKEKSVMEEGCLSIPGFYGLVERPEKITLLGQDKNNKKMKIKAWGLLARVFQHETDHLNGILFTDRTKKVYKISQGDEKQL